MVAAGLKRIDATQLPDTGGENDHDMKWKKFLYKQLCIQEGVYLRRAPSCAVCCDLFPVFWPGRVTPETESPLCYLSPNSLLFTYSAVFGSAAMDYTIRTILYATDLGPHGVEVFNHAFSLAKQYGAKIHVVHALEPMSDYAQSWSKPWYRPMP